MFCCCNNRRLLGPVSSELLRNPFAFVTAAQMLQFRGHLFYNIFAALKLTNRFVQEKNIYIFFTNIHKLGCSRSPLHFFGIFASMDPSFHAFKSFHVPAASALPVYFVRLPKDAS